MHRPSTVGAVTYPQYDYGQQPQDPTQYGQYPQQPGYPAQPGYQQPGYQQPGYQQPGYPSDPYGQSQPQYDPNAYYAGYGGGPTPQERSDAATGNYLGLIGLAGIVWGLIGPAVFRSNQGSRSAFVRESTTNALNFHLSILIYTFGGSMVLCILGFVLAFATMGIGFILSLLAYPLVFGMMIWQAIASGIGGSRASRGEIFSYPGAIRMFKD